MGEVSVVGQGTEGGKCVDKDIVRRVFGNNRAGKKDYNEWKKEGKYYNTRHMVILSSMSGKTKANHDKLKEDPEFNRTMDSLKLGWQKTNFLMSSLLNLYEADIPAERQNVEKEFRLARQRPKQTFQSYCAYLRKLNQKLTALGRPKLDEDLIYKMETTLLGIDKRCAEQVSSYKSSLDEWLLRMELQRNKVEEMVKQERKKKRKYDGNSDGSENE